ncbi:HAD family hydrolase (plasmid) [Streptomyces sp. BI20]|uniref:HAD family hydrolase n=1 Tax=Streptomyces sp. BI20 TaxID=3403460 RepID=UPI003C773DAF
MSGRDGVRGARVAAFFDVDETLVDLKSMFRFLSFHLRRGGAAPGTDTRLLDALRGAAADGVPRTEINRRYYRLFAGESRAELAASGREWFAAELREEPFIAPVVERFHAHRERGETTVLISGSFFACLDPIAEHLGADLAFGTRPRVGADGRLTGEVFVPLIGEAKGRTARAVGAVLDLDLSRSWGYGDHASDLHLLEAVGRPVVVGADPVLRARAARGGWEVLPLAEPESGPAPVPGPVSGSGAAAASARVPEGVSG